jgi:DNA modification methylase
MGDSLGHTDRNMQLIQGDCLEELPRIEAGSVDLAVTSPPYFNAMAYSQFESYAKYLDFIGEFLTGVKRVLKPCRILALNVSCVIEPREKRSKESTRLPIPFDCMQLARDIGFKFIDDIIWQKPDGAAGGRGRKFAQCRRPVGYKPFTVTEYILVFKNGEGLLDNVIRAHSQDEIRESLVADGYERTNVWRIQPETNSTHPAPYPLELVTKIVKYYSFVGDTVLDPFAGSGTTAIACKNLGRNFIGIEKDEGYFNIAKERIDGRL